MSASPEVAARPLAASPGADSTRRPRAHVYGRAFWCAYVSNLVLMVAYTLMYRYADFVLYLGGTAGTVGRIVGIGMVGSLVMRFFQGMASTTSDRAKSGWPRWLGFVVSLLGPRLYHRQRRRCRRFTCCACCTAPAWPARLARSITSVSRSLPLARMAEVIGSLGTSGFIGMVLGPQLGDLLCGHEDIIALAT